MVLGTKPVAAGRAAREGVEALPGRAVHKSLH